MEREVADGLKAEAEAVGLDHVAVGAMVLVPTRFTESLAQIDLGGPALTVGLTVMLTFTVPVTGAQPALEAEMVSTTVVGAAAFSEGAGL